MLLEPGHIFRVAPRFHCRAAWAERLQLNGGATRRADTVCPRADWRAATVAELAVLAPSGTSDASPLEAAHWALLTIPAHVRQRWWDAAERGEAGEGTQPGYDAFVADVLELLRFKGLPVPPRCAAAVLVNRPGQTSTRLDGSGRLAGFCFGSLVPSSAAHGADDPIAVFNLGDEFAHLVMLNLGVHALRARLAVDDATVADEILSTFYLRQPAYPLVRVRLDPGEGLWLSSPPPAFDGWTVGKADLDALLVLQA